MATPQPFRLICPPGIKRDGTLFEGDEYKDGLWCRFSRRGLPRKINGYKAITSQLPEVVRGMAAYFQGAVNYIHVGSQSFLQQQLSDMQGNPGALTDRTPAGFTASANNLWQLEQFYNSATGATTLVANAGQNLNDITNAVETPIYYGPVTGATALVATNMPNVSGGCVALDPYLIGYSNYGRIDVSPINNIATGTINSAFISDQKIIKGLPLRNGGGGPAGLFWSLGSLLLASYNAALFSGIPFNFNTISDEVSVLSSQSIVEFDGIYYWPEIDHFSMFNGVVQELPNALNLDFFFANLNFLQRQKVFAIKVQSAGEIWWCFPSGASTECNWAIIYNVYLKTWYDTPLPDLGRSSGVSPRVFNKPYMADLAVTSTGYTLWQHETGKDKTISGSSFPIKSYFTTSEFSPLKGQPAGRDKAYRASIMEPDFGNVGAITVNLLGRANTQVSQTVLDTKPVAATVQTTDDQTLKFKDNARLMAFQVVSNTPGGDFYLGHTIVHMEETDGRYTQ